MSKMHVIYVPGLGDHKVFKQKVAIALWGIYGVVPHLVSLKWAEGNDFSKKLDHLLDVIDVYYEKSGLPVGLVGASAGASAVLQVYDLKKNKVAAVVCISGKIQHPENMHPNTFIQNPAFKQSMENLQIALARLTTEDRLRILSVYSAKDTIVPAEDSKLDGAIEKQDGGLGHGLAIAKQLTIKARSNIAFLKKHV
jgi:dienelactone hydrolase